MDKNLMIEIKADTEQAKKEIEELKREIKEFSKEIRSGDIDLKFKKMIQAIKDKDFVRAPEEAKNSKWCEQVKSRCEDVCELFLNL